MKSTIYPLILFFLFSLFGPTYAQQLTRSEALLSGLEQIPEVPSLGQKRIDFSFPDQIEIPQAWRDGFKELIRRQKETGNEQGACLSVTQEARSEYAQAQLKFLQAYSKLMSAKPKLSNADFHAQTSKIRDELNKLSFTRGLNDLKWEIGATQGGNTSSVHLHSGLTTCNSNNVGNVHTHPVLNASEPSMADFLGTVFPHDRLQKIEFIVDLSSNVCAVSAPKLGFWLQLNQVLVDFLYNFGKDYSDEDMSNKLSSVIAGDSLENGFTGNSHNAKLIAKHLQYRNAAMYCGKIDQPLVKVKPLPESDTADVRGAVLALKAVIAAKKYAFKLPTQELDFDFNPVFDEGLSKHLLTHSAKRVTFDPKYLSLVNNKIVSGLLSFETSVPDPRTGYRNPILFEPNPKGFIAPERSRTGKDAVAQTYVSYQFFPSFTGKGVRANLVSFQLDQAKAKQGVLAQINLRFFGSWDESTGFSEMVNPETGVGTQYFPQKNNLRYKGTYTWEKGNAVRNGMFEMEDDKYKKIGMMQNNIFTGSYRLLDKQTGIWTTETSK